LRDRTAVITGAASGIGKEIARKFVAEGAQVAVADINLDAAGATAAELGANAMGVAMDVTDEAQVEAGMDGVVERFGGIDVLVSNAGVQMVAPLDEFEFSDWRRLLAIHLDGPS
jgi:3-hydroxybutyrate dehydrogenase